MRIRRLKLSGFKSFVEPAELRIEAGLTGVVGPNGCGKSNLLEAIRWVMGESSARSLRGGGMEDVIFAGTAQRPPRDFAEVVLFAEGQDKQDLEVVRRIERGAGSAYRVNGRDVRAKDVSLIFADAATGAHSPALVSQGRIAGVIAAPARHLIWRGAAERALAVLLCASTVAARTNKKKHCIPLAFALLAARPPGPEPRRGTTAGARTKSAPGQKIETLIKVKV